jgi:hypothetical protein
LWYKATIKRDDSCTISENNVCIIYLFFFFGRFDVFAVLKICFFMFLSCFFHVPYRFVTGCLQVSFMFFPCFFHVFVMFIQFCITSFYIFFVHVSNIMMFCKLWDRVYSVLIKLLPCFNIFEMFLFNFFHIPGVCSKWLFESIRQSCWCNQVAILYPMFKGNLKLTQVLWEEHFNRITRPRSTKTCLKPSDDILHFAT